MTIPTLLPTLPGNYTSPFSEALWLIIWISIVDFIAFFLFLKVLSPILEIRSMSDYLAKKNC